MVNHNTELLDNNYMWLESFSTEGIHTGGATGSLKVQGKDGLFYQLKRSIFDASLFRQARADRLDTEIFIEVIASAVSRSVLQSDDGTQLIPTVKLLYDRKEKKVLVASRYLPEVVGTLEQHAFNSVSGFSKTHTEVSDSENHVEDNLNRQNIDDTYLRQDLMDAVAVSAVNGDHDVNLGNMLVVKNSEGIARIARIDLGHAFNNLIRLARWSGGQVRNKENAMLDFFNRETIPHIMPSRRETKLWASYDDMIPSEELVTSLKKVGNSQHIIQGIRNAIKPCQALINDLETDPEGNKEILTHIKKSLIAINENIEAKKVPSSLSAQDVLDSIFANIQRFYQKNQSDMLDVAQLMELQLKIDKLIVTKKEGREISSDLVKEIQENYDVLRGIKGISSEKGIRWVKSSRNIEGFEGTVEEFLHRRAVRHGILVETKINTIDDFVNQPIAKNSALNAMINESEIVAHFLDMSVQRYVVHKNKKFRDEVSEAGVIHNTTEDLQQFLANFAGQAGQDPGITAIISNLHENLPQFINKVDKNLTKGITEILKKEGLDIKKASSTELQEALNQASINNLYTCMSREIREGSLLNKEGETIWKLLAKFFAELSMPKVAKFFEEKHEQVKAALLAAKVGWRPEIITSAVEITKPVRRKFTSTISGNKDTTKPDISGRNVNNNLIKK